MARNLFNRFFPVPKFLLTPSFGLDISDESLKFIELISTGKEVKIGKYGEKRIPVGVIESGKIKNPKVFTEILLTLRKEAGVKAVRVSLPEEQVYLFKLSLEKASLKSIREGIELSMEEYVPIKTEEAIFDYEIITEDKERVEVQVVAVPQVIVEDYLSVFRDAKISVYSLELEAEALVRSIVKSKDMETYMIVDFGEKRTGISIVSGGIIMFASTIDFGGNILTNLIQKELKINFKEAEEIKKKYGLGRNLENKEIFSVLLNGVSILRDEIEKHFLYWHTYKENEKNSRPPIKKIILCGGNSNLIGITEYFSVSMKTTVEVANVWVNIIDTNKHIPEINSNESLSFATAIGLALENIKYD